MPKITRTYGPIHFEDLDRHRFEDLIRELIYDYKDWQSIEATGRSGGDEGFDIRAYERLASLTTIDQEDESQPAVHLMMGKFLDDPMQERKGDWTKETRKISRGD